MRARIREMVIFGSLAALLSPFAARGELERTGPTDPAHGFPQWYQDKTGLTLEFCQPTNQAELDGGWCLLLPGDTTVPEAFPAAFADEHFWWAGDAGIDYAPPQGGRGRALLVLGLEAAFGIGPVVAGDQVTFGRVRVRLDPVPYDGDYTIYTPFTEWHFTLTAGERLFFTEDIGFTCPPGVFDCALSSSLGPFLLASDVPGGAELPPVAGPVPGKLYIADPARVGPVTGSVRPNFVASDGLERNHNIFRIEGPPGTGWALETTDFTLMGRIYTGQMPGRVRVDRASYTRNAAEGTRVDVFANATPTMATRLPAQPRPAVQAPVLGYYPAACVTDPATGLPTEPAGLPVVAMFNRGASYWGQTTLAAPPAAVCVEDYTARDATGQVVSAFFNAPVTDFVDLTRAEFDPSAARLTVEGASSDEGLQTLTLLGFENADGTPREFATSVVVDGVTATPAKIRVRSSAGYVAEKDVTTLLGALASPTVPVAGNDDYTLLEDSGEVVWNVLGNDTVNGSPIAFGPNVAVAITIAPRLGTASVTPDGRIAFTPAPDAFGTDGIAYTVTVDGATSSAAYITIHITNVNDAPVAVDDTAQTVAGIPAQVNVLANDIDADGAADLVRAVAVSVPAGVTVTDGPTLGIVAAAAGTYAITYQAEDASGARSGNATVTVTVAGAETITITLAQFRRDTARMRVDGTSSVHAGQTVSVSWANGTAAGTVFATAVVDAAGLFSVDIRPASGIQNPTTTGATRVRVTSPYGGNTTAGITFR